jgi:hypothetical protein
MGETDENELDSTYKKQIIRRLTYETKW